MNQHCVTASVFLSDNVVGLRSHLAAELQARANGQTPITELPSDNLIPAFRTELCAGLKLCSALTAFILRPQSFAALRTELCSLRASTAGRTKRHRFSRQVHALGQVLLLQLLLQLIYKLIFRYV